MHRNPSLRTAGASERANSPHPDSEHPVSEADSSQIQVNAGGDRRSKTPSPSSSPARRARERVLGQGGIGSDSVGCFEAVVRSDTAALKKNSDEIFG